MTKEEVESKFRELCVTPSDINQHLSTLRHYADQCKHVTEFGTRSCVSLFAFLSSNAEKVVAVDIADVWTPEVEKLTFICADDLEIEIEETDMLFIDTRHCYVQMKAELAKHAGKVRKFIGAHDVSIFGVHGDDGGKGLMPAIEEFCMENTEWVVIYLTMENNGLLIMERQ